jgi:hypothetical protein
MMRIDIEISSNCLEIFGAMTSRIFPIIILITYYFIKILS